jgi:hypothetical protein
MGASAINLRDEEIRAEIQAARELAQRDAIADQYREAYVGGTALGDELKGWGDQSSWSEEVRDPDPRRPAGSDEN